MSAPKQEPTPEEKLLALIQQDKHQDKTSAVPVQPVSPAGGERKGPPTASLTSPAPIKPLATPLADSARQVAKAEPPPEKRLKLAAEPATVVPASIKEPVVEQKAIASKAGHSSVDKQGEGGALSGRKEKPQGVVAASGKEESGDAKQVSPAMETPVGSVPLRPQMVTMRRGGLVLINRVLALVVLVLLVLVVYNVSSIRADVAEEVAKQVVGAGTFPLAPLVVTSEAIPALDYYLGKVAKRDISVRVGDQPQPPVPPKPMGKAEDLKLVGISLDTATPEESLAIIRTKADSKTLFVKLGQSVGETGFTLERVLSDRVILKSNKQEFELK